MNDLNFKLLNSGLDENSVVLEATACLNCPKPSCISGCPIQNRIPEFIKAAKEKDFRLAFEIIKEKSMLPALCGALCPHEKQCQGHCVKNKIGKPVKIGAIERFIGEYALNHGFDIDNDIKLNGKRVLVVGSGPASLGASYYLARHGYKVNVIEKKNKLGGLLKYGIPSFRFDYGVLDKIINSLKEMGVEFKTNTAFLKDITLEDAQRDYDAIFLGTGTDETNRVNTPGVNLPGVVYANEFLKNINLIECDSNFQKDYAACGEHVVVVGGGNVAMDAARVALRLKQVKDVTIIYRRTENEMPAERIELEDAKREGIKFLPLTNPVRYIGDDVLKEIECETMVLSDPDESGRRRPIPSNNPHFMVKADTVILALGYVNEKQIDEIETGKWNNIIVDDDSMTSINNVYAGGDNVTGSLTIVSAMKAGLTAAKAIVRKDEYGTKE